jgi:hypothetical protein
MNRETLMEAINGISTECTTTDAAGLKEMLNNLYEGQQKAFDIKPETTLDSENATGPDTDRLKEMLNGILRQRQEIKRMMKATERDGKIRTILEEK